MTLYAVIFYLFASVAVFSSLMVILARDTMHSALFLVLTFFAMAGVWLLLQAEFLALILVLVYVGAVMTLFLFVVMMLQTKKTTLRAGYVRYVPMGAGLIVLTIGLLMMVFSADYYGLAAMPAPALKAAAYSNTAALGSVLYTDYVLPFEMAGVLLLTAIIAAISLAHRAPTRRKSQIPSKQIATKRSDRVKLIKMSAEPKLTIHDRGVE